MTLRGFIAEQLEGTIDFNWPDNIDVLDAIVDLFEVHETYRNLVPPFPVYYKLTAKQAHRSSNE